MSDESEGGDEGSEECSQENREGDAESTSESEEQNAHDLDVEALEQILEAYIAEAKDSPAESYEKHETEHAYDFHFHGRQPEEPMTEERIEAIISRAKAAGLEGFAYTPHTYIKGNLENIVKMAKRARKGDIRIIIGTEFLFTVGDKPSENRKKGKDDGVKKGEVIVLVDSIQTLLEIHAYYIEHYGKSTEEGFIPTYDSLMSVIDSLKARGHSIVTITAHPFDIRRPLVDKNTMKPIVDLSKVDAVELNLLSGHYTFKDREAEYSATSGLASMLGKPVVYSSDWHGRGIGRAKTFYSKPIEGVKDILKPVGNNFFYGPAVGESISKGASIRNASFSFI